MVTILKLFSGLDIADNAKYVIQMYVKFPAMVDGSVTAEIAIDGDQSWTQ